MKKIAFMLTVVVSFLFFNQIAFADFNCNIETTCNDPGEVKLFRISAITNAHVEKKTYTNYGNTACLSISSGRERLN